MCPHPPAELWNHPDVWLRPGKGWLGIADWLVREGMIGEPMPNYMRFTNDPMVTEVIGAIFGCGETVEGRSDRHNAGLDFELPANARQSAVGEAVF